MISIRPVHESDLPSLARTSEDAPYLTQWAPRTQKWWSDWYANLENRPTDAMYVIASCLGPVIGLIGLHDLDWRHRRASVSIAIVPENRGKGYGQKALELLCTHAFSTINLHRLWSTIDTRNSASIRCFLKAGFSNEGYLRQHSFANGTFADSIIMGKVAS